MSNPLRIFVPVKRVVDYGKYIEILSDVPDTFPL